MATIAVTFAEVEDGRQAVLTLCNELAENLDNLEHILAPVRASWSGAASEGFEETYARWRADAEALHEDLTWIHSMVCNAQTNFAAAHAAVLSTWQAD
ncbi:MAG TPA: WXG100 family type VII secretion target [Actinospica sp.]|nr:WXG100 family type VII secretion target [Actinospica sp.]